MYACMLDVGSPRDAKGQAGGTKRVRASKDDGCNQSKNGTKGGVRGVLRRERVPQCMAGGRRRYRRTKEMEPKCFKARSGCFFAPRPQETRVGRLTGPLPVCAVEA